MFFRLVMVSALAASLLVAQATPSVAREVHSGTKTCDDGQHVIIFSDAQGWVTHSFRTGPDAKTYRQRFGTPTLPTFRITYTWKQSVQWQVRAEDTDDWDGEIDEVMVYCESISHGTPDKPYIYRHGYKTCPKGKYVWIKTHYYDHFLHRWYTDSSDQYKNNWGGSPLDSTDWVVTPTWKQSAYWRVFVYGDRRELLSNRVFCAASSGGQHD